MKIQTKMLKRLISILCAATMAASGAVASVGAVDPAKKGKQSKSASVGAADPAKKGKQSKSASVGVGKGQDSVKPGYVSQYKKKLDFNKEKRIINSENIGKEQEAKLKKIRAAIRKEIKNLDVKIEREERKNKINEKVNAAKVRRDEMEQKEAERNVQKAKDFSNKYEELKEDFNNRFEKLANKLKVAYNWNVKHKPEKSAIHSILTKYNNLMKQCDELKNKIKNNDACKRFMPKTRKDKIYMLDKPLMERISKTNEQLEDANISFTKDYKDVWDKYYDDVLDKYYEKQRKELDKKKLINKEANKDKIVIKNNKVDNTNKTGNTYTQIYKKQKLIKINNKAKNTEKKYVKSNKIPKPNLSKKKIAFSSK